MKVLVVDDDPSLREYLSEAIRTRGHEVITAGDGEEGLRTFFSESPDLILTDVQMPHMDGLRFLSEVRERDREVIVIVITGLGGEEVVLEALRRHANDYVRKPIHSRVLLPLLAKYSPIAETRSMTRQTLGFYESKSLVLKFDNRLELVPHVVCQLLAECGDAISGDQRLGVRLGLEELLVNAIEHGNLGVTNEEKRAVLANRYSGLEALIATRMARPELAGRRVIVEATMTRKHCRWRISDEGDGFDWHRVLEAQIQDSLEEPSGRGIFLARFQFDEIAFLGRGNQVEVTKRLAPCAPGPP